MQSRRRSSMQIIPKGPTQAVPMPQPIKESSFGSVIKQGFGWGLGNSLAHTLMNTMISKPEVSEPVPTVKFDTTPLVYKQCMLEFDDREACKHLLK